MLSSYYVFTAIMESRESSRVCTGVHFTVPMCTLVCHNLYFLVINNCLLLCRLFPFDDAKIWLFFRRNKIFAVFRLSLLRQLCRIATNQRHSEKSCRKLHRRTDPSVYEILMISQA